MRLIYAPYVGAGLQPGTPMDRCLQENPSIATSGQILLLINPPFLSKKKLRPNRRLPRIFLSNNSSLGDL
jgi:hypothetical protein